MRDKSLDEDPSGDLGIKVSIALALVLILLLCFLLGRLIIGPWLGKHIQKSVGAPTEATGSRSLRGWETPKPESKRPQTYIPRQSQVFIIPESGMPEPTAATKSKTVLRMPSVRRPPEEPKPSVKPAEITVPRPSVSKEYLIQIGSFVNKDNCDALMEELKQKGYQPSSVAEEQEDGTVLYKVHIGGFKDKVEAERVQEKLQTDGYSTFIPQE